MWLLAERELGAESAVSGYIAYLPQPGCASFYDAPLHWAEEELRELQYPPMIGAVYEQREQIKVRSNPNPNPNPSPNPNPNLRAARADQGSA